MRNRQTKWKRFGVIAAIILFGSPAGCLSILRVAAANEAISVTVDHSGCAIKQPSEALDLRLWRAAHHPGDGSAFPPVTTLTGRWTTVFDAEPGYYRVELASKHCWEEFFPVAVLPGRSRHIRLKPREWVREEHTLYTFFTPPYGAVVGQLKIGESAPTLLRVGEPGNTGSPASVEPDRCYYFDQVITGSYTLSIPSEKAVVRKTIDVSDNKITIVPNF